MVIRARFDGRVFVPEQPVDLPAGSIVEIELDTEQQPTTESASNPAVERPLLQLIERLDQFPSDPNWPKDAAAQHDHYLHGSPKRP